MIDIRLLRKNPEKLKEALGKKKFTCDVDDALRWDSRRRACIHQVESLRARQKSSNQEMSRLDKKSHEFRDKVATMKVLAKELKSLMAEQGEIEARWREALLSIPNCPHQSVPVGKDERDNAVVEIWGDPDGVSAHAIAHFDHPEFSHWVDLKGGTKVTGSGFPFYRGFMAKLVRGMINFFIDQAAAAGFEEIIPPLLVNAESATATGQLPDKEGQMYEVSENGLFLIPTAEVPVTNLYRDSIFACDELPRLHCAYTPCFRREAGSWGRHVRGLNRLHQFDKVELVKWVHPEASYHELESLRTYVEELLRKLELPFRVLNMCSGEIGFPHAKQYDFEVWSGGQKRWLEVSSCSNFTDFQARRANIRYRAAEGRLAHVHTLNGSGLGMARTLAALLENNTREDGVVSLPAVLHDYVGMKQMG